MSGKTEVPALDRALDILELITDAGPLGYKGIVDRLSVPQASAARILKRLCLRGYAVKDKSGAYGPGPALSALQSAMTMASSLRRVGTPVLQRLRETLSETAILFHWSGVAWECIAKEAHEDSIAMQTVGEIRVDIFDYPWGVFAYEQLCREERRLVLNLKEANLQKELKTFQKRGYAFSAGKLFSRIAVPIKDEKDDLVGAFAMGVTSTCLKEFGRQAIADLLRAGRDEIESKIRRSTA